MKMIDKQRLKRIAIEVGIWVFGAAMLILNIFAYLITYWNNTGQL